MSRQIQITEDIQGVLKNPKLDIPKSVLDFLDEKLAQQFTGSASTASGLTNVPKTGAIQGEPLMAEGLEMLSNVPKTGIQGEPLIAEAVEAETFPVITEGLEMLGLEGLGLEGLGLAGLGLAGLEGLGLAAAPEITIPAMLAKGVYDYLNTDKSKPAVMGIPKSELQKTDTPKIDESQLINLQKTQANYNMTNSKSKIDPLTRSRFKRFALNADYKDILDDIAIDEIELGTPHTGDIIKKLKNRQEVLKAQREFILKDKLPEPPQTPLVQDLSVLKIISKKGLSNDGKIFVKSKLEKLINDEQLRTTPKVISSLEKLIEFVNSDDLPLSPSDLRFLRSTSFDKLQNDKKTLMDMISDLQVISNYMKLLNDDIKNQSIPNISKKRDEFREYSQKYQTKRLEIIQLTERLKIKIMEKIKKIVAANPDDSDDPFQEFQIEEDDSKKEFPELFKESGQNPEDPNPEDPEDDPDKDPEDPDDDDDDDDDDDEDKDPEDPEDKDYRRYPNPDDPNNPDYRRYKDYKDDPNYRRYKDDPNDYRKDQDYSDCQDYRKDQDYTKNEQDPLLVFLQKCPETKKKKNIININVKTQ